MGQEPEFAMTENKVTTAQAIEEFAPLKRFGRALDKLDTVLAGAAQAESREKSANATVEKLQGLIAALTTKKADLDQDIESLGSIRVDRETEIAQDLKDYEDTETEELNERLNRVRANIAKQEQEYGKKEADGFSRLRLQGEEIEAREKRYTELGRLIDKIQAKFSPVDQRA